MSKSAINKFLLFVFLLTCTTLVSRSQTVTDAPSFQGFSLQKSVSLSSALSGQIFTYTVTFTLQDGAVISGLLDQVPAELEIVGPIIHPASYSGNIPIFATSGNAVSLTFAGAIVGNISGSFQINVRFPPNKACAGLVASNQVVLKGSIPTFYIETGYLNTTCIVNNPWNLQKTFTTSTYIGGACGYGTLSDTVEYLIKIVKTSGTILGATTLNVSTLHDILPSGTGAYVLTSSLVTNIPGGAIDAAGNISFTSGFFLDPAVNIPYTAKFKVAYPSMVTGICIANIAELTGTIPCNTAVDLRDTTTVIRTDSVPGNPRIVKTVTTTGNLPGCTGLYTITVINDGYTPLNAYTLVDNFPSCLLNVHSDFVSPGCSVSGTSPNFTINGPSLISHGQSHTYTFSFTIGETCPSTFTNTVTATEGITGSASATVAMLPNIAKPCILKTICGSAIHHVGDTVRFRIRVQNIGSVPLTDAVITDNLDMQNLSYIGDEAAYSAPTAAPVACNPSITGDILPWPVTSHHLPATGELSWTLPAIPVECDRITNPVCGSAYYLPAYYIEFSVKILDTAGLGNIRNIATIGSGNIIAPAASAVSIVTNGFVNYTLKKSLSADNGANYASNVSASAGSTLRYKLQAINDGIGIRNATLVDLLPRDNGSSDNFILHNDPRGSGGFDIRQNGTISSNYGIAAQSYSTASGIKTSPELGTTVNSGAPSWSSTALTDAANIKAQLSGTIGSTALEYIFDATIDPEARLKDFACNTFALRGFGKYVTNYIVNNQPLPALESTKACVDITAPDTCCNPYDFQVPKEICLNNNTQFCAKDSCDDSENSYTWNFGDGSPNVTGSCVMHAYNHEGNYTIGLKWVNHCGEAFVKKFDVIVKKCDCKIDVSFKVTAQGLNIVADGSATTSSQPIAVYVWDFGDGTVGMGQITTHTYSSDGSYIVKLTVYSMNEKGEICDCKNECAKKISLRNIRGVRIFSCNAREATPIIELKGADNLIGMTALPNPFSDKIAVSFTQDDKTKNPATAGYLLEFANAQGIILQSRKLQNLASPVVFDTRKYSSGIYFILLKNADGNIQNNKVVKLN